MPDVHGNVTAGDLAQGLVQSYHLRDESVVTAKIPDLAVTFPDKVDDPIWVSGFQDTLFHNTSLSNGVRTSFNTTIDVPAWVDAVSVVATATFQIYNTSGIDNLLSVWVLVDGEKFGPGADHEAPTDSTGAVSMTFGADLVGVAGSSIMAGAGVWVQGADSTSNRAQVAGLVVGRR